MNDGTQIRAFEVLAPALPIDARIPLSLTIVFHGANSTSKDARRFGLQDAPGASASSIFIFPQGLESPLGGGVGWYEYPCSSYDFAFFDAMVEWASSHYCVDTSRIYVAGFSWGGDMATSLACCRGSGIRAIAAGSCTDDFSDPTTYKTFKALPCPTANAAAIRFTHDASGADSSYPTPNFATTSSLFQSLNGCRPTEATSGNCTAYAGCGPDTPYIECTYRALGHALPPTWANDTWAFFSASGQKR